MHAILDSWILIPIWFAIYLLDNYLTVYVARLYKQQDPVYVQFEGGYELTPQYKDEIEQLKLFGPRFIRAAIITTFLTILVWLLAYSGWGYPQMYKLLMGALILLGAVVNLRHVQNVSFFVFHDEGSQPQGSIFYPQKMLYRGSAHALAAHGVFFLFLALILGSWFFAGGMLSCLSTAWSHYRLAKKSPAPA
jgi:hypothetical protein